jgi:hypothetical protein
MELKIDELAFENTVRENITSHVAPYGTRVRDF